ncbi:Tyrosine-protein kinase transmembrane receptor Ror2 [Armadillidium vulgare]|nr:Tyrosine-protein kinase transmembrane receptor Ror2 [Armadillidium vulgare]
MIKLRIFILVLKPKPKLGNFPSCGQPKIKTIKEGIVESQFFELCRFSSKVAIYYTNPNKLLCRFAFPECHLTEGSYQQGYPLCHQDCVAVQHLFCVNEWLLITERNKKGESRAREHFQLPVCDDLPMYKEDEEQTCSHVALTSMIV